VHWFALSGQESLEPREYSKALAEFMNLPLYEYRDNKQVHTYAWIPHGEPQA